MKSRFGGSAGKKLTIAFILTLLFASGVLAILSSAHTASADSDPIATGNWTYDQYDSIIVAQAQQYGIDPFVIKGQIMLESVFNTYAQSILPNPSCGWTHDLGLMQVNPYCNGLDPSSLYDPWTNIHFGTAQISSLVHLFGDVSLALQAYNIGTQSVQAGIRNWAYSSGVLSYAQQFRSDHTANYGSYSAPSSTSSSSTITKDSTSSSSSTSSYSSSSTTTSASTTSHSTSSSSSSSESVAHITKTTSPSSSVSTTSQITLRSIASSSASNQSKSGILSLEMVMNKMNFVSSPTGAGGGIVAGAKLPSPNIYSGAVISPPPAAVPSSSPSLAASIVGANQSQVIVAPHSSGSVSDAAEAAGGLIALLGVFAFIGVLPMGESNASKETEQDHT